MSLTLHSAPIGCTLLYAFSGRAISGRVCVGYNHAVRRDRSARASVMGLILCACLLPTCAADDISVASIIADMKRFDDAFNSAPAWRIAFRFNKRAVTLPPGLKEVPPADYVTAKKHNAWYLLKVDSIAQEAVVYEQGISRSKSPHDYHIAGEPHPHLYQLFHYTDGVFLDIYRGLKVESPAMQEALGTSSISALRSDLLPAGIERDLSQYQLLPESVVIDGAECRVLEWHGRDRISVDVSLGCAVRQRKCNMSPDLPVLEQHNSDFFEAAPGMWFPQRQRRLAYNANGSPREFAGTVRYDQSIELVAFSFGEFSVDEFDVSPPDSGMVIDAVRGTAFEIAHEPVKHLELNAMSYEPVVSPWTNLWNWGAAIVLGGALLAISYRAFSMFRQWRSA